MALARYVVQDEGGERIGPFVSTRSEWRKGDRLVIGGSLYRVIAVVSFDRPDEAGAIAALTVAQTI